MRSGTAKRILLGVCLFAVVFPVVMAIDYFGWDMPIVVEAVFVAALALVLVTLLNRLWPDVSDSE